MLVEHIDSILKKWFTLIKAKHDQFHDHSYKQTLHSMSYIQAVVCCTEERKREKKRPKKRQQMQRTTFESLRSEEWRPPKWKIHSPTKLLFWAGPKQK